MKNRSQTKSFFMAGGIGNQLFILTAGTYYSLQNKESVIFDFSRYDNATPPHGSDIRLLNPNARFQYRPFRNLVIAGLDKISHRTCQAFFPTYTSSSVGYDPALETRVLEDSIFGYFQTYKYLEHPEVRKIVDSLFLDSVSEWYDKCSSEMLEIPTISVHIRRGDYINVKDSFGVLSCSYYNSAINSMLENSSINYARVLVFSDDIDAAKQIFGQLDISLPVQFAQPPQDSPEETLLLMSKSDALVISNSTFSWWAAQLGNNAKFVVYPSKWFRGMSDPKDLFPPEWYPQESQWEI